MGHDRNANYGGSRNAKRNEYESLYWITDTREITPGVCDHNTLRLAALPTALNFPLDVCDTRLSGCYDQKSGLQITKINLQIRRKSFLLKCIFFNKNQIFIQKQFFLLLKQLFFRLKNTFWNEMVCHEKDAYLLFGIFKWKRLFESWLATNETRRNNASHSVIFLIPLTRYFKNKISVRNLIFACSIYVTHI